VASNDVRNLNDRGRRNVSREELYALVGETPLSRLAKNFGMSDVGLRKVCVKHNIPTPPLGYWAKRAHGKRVRQPPLPPGKNSTIPIVFREAPEGDPEIVAAQEEALAREAAYEGVTVSAELPDRLQAVTAATAAALKASKLDEDGFKSASVSKGVHVTVSPASVERVLRTIDAFARAAETRGYTITEGTNGVRIVAGEIPFGK